MRAFQTASCEPPEVSSEPLALASSRALRAGGDDVGHGVVRALAGLRVHLGGLPMMPKAGSYAAISMVSMAEPSCLASSDGLADEVDQALQRAADWCS